MKKDEIWKENANKNGRVCKKMEKQGHSCSWAGSWGFRFRPVTDREHTFLVRVGGNSTDPWIWIHRRNMGLDLWDPGDAAVDVQEESNLCTSKWIEIGVGSALKYKVKGVVTNRSKKWDQSIGLPLSCATENVIRDLLSFLHTVRGKKHQRLACINVWIWHDVFHVGANIVLL